MDDRKLGRGFMHRYMCVGGWVCGCEFGAGKQIRRITLKNQRRCASSGWAMPSLAAKTSAAEVGEDIGLEHEGDERLGAFNDA